MLFNFRKWAYSFYLDITRFRHLLEFCLRPAMVMARQDWWPVVAKQILTSMRSMTTCSELSLLLRNMDQVLPPARRLSWSHRHSALFFLYILFSLPLLPFFCFPLFSIYFPSSLASCPPFFFPCSPLSSFLSSFPLYLCLLSLSHWPPGCLPENTFEMKTQPNGEKEEEAKALEQSNNHLHGEEEKILWYKEESGRWG